MLPFCLTFIFFYCFLLLPYDINNSIVFEFTVFYERRCVGFLYHLHKFVHIIYIYPVHDLLVSHSYDKVAIVFRNIKKTITTLKNTLNDILFRNFKKYAKIIKSIKDIVMFDNSLPHFSRNENLFPIIFDTIPFKANVFHSGKGRSGFPIFTDNVT